MSSEYEKLKTEIDRFIMMIKHYEDALIGIPNALDDLFELNVANPALISQMDMRIKLKDRDEMESIVKTMKSNVILMLYNLVEAMIRMSMQNYYDRFNDKKLTFSQTIESIQKLWIKKSLSKVKNDQLKTEVFNMINNSIDQEYKIEMEKEDFYLSGNADVKGIKNILDNHGVIYETKGFSNYGGALVTIKNGRNKLAHGNISFEDNGKNFSIEQIIELKTKTYNCIDYFISIIDNEYR